MSDDTDRLTAIRARLAEDGCDRADAAWLCDEVERLRGRWERAIPRIREWVREFRGRSALRTTGYTMAFAEALGMATTAWLRWHRAIPRIRARVVALRGLLARSAVSVADLARAERELAVSAADCLACSRVPAVDLLAARAEVEALQRAILWVHGHQRAGVEEQAQCMREDGDEEAARAVERAREVDHGTR